MLVTSAYRINRRSAAPASAAAGARRRVRLGGQPILWFHFLR
jgi:hypothetical protein